MYKGIYGNIENDLIKVGRFKQSKVFVTNRINEIYSDKRLKAEFLEFSYFIFMSNIWLYRNIRAIAFAKKQIKRIVYRKGEEITIIDNFFMNRSIVKIIEYNKSNIGKSIPQI